MSVTVTVAGMLALTILAGVFRGPVCVQCGGRLKHRRGCKQGQ